MSVPSRHRFNRPAYFVAAFLGLILASCHRDNDTYTERGVIADLQERGRLRPPTAEINFGYIHHFDGLDVDPVPPLEITTDQGDLITIEHIALVVSALELHRCAPTNIHSTLHDRLIPSAHAHVPSSATRFGTPWVEDLLATPGNARMVGGVAPPPGTYCELHIILAPADDDVINITALSPDEIDGHTLLIRGTFQRGSRTSPVEPFEWTSSYRGVVSLPLTDPQTGESPLRLDSPDRQLLFLLDKRISPRTLQPPPLSDPGPDFQPFFATLLRSFSIYQYQ